MKICYLAKTTGLQAQPILYPRVNLQSIFVCLQICYGQASITNIIQVV